MDILSSLVVYFMLLVLVFVIMYWRGKVKAWSALTFSVIVSYVFLFLMYSPYNVINEDSIVLLSIYTTVVVLSPVVILAYALSMSIFDFR